MHVLIGNPLLFTLDFSLSSLSFCYMYIILMSKQKRILILFGRENKSEEHRQQTETSRSDNVDEDKFSDTDEREPYMVGKIQVVAIRQHKRVIMKRKMERRIFKKNT